MLLFALAMDAALPPRQVAMERCAEAAIDAVRGPVGMADVTGTTFEWLSISGKDPDWVIIGSVIDPPAAADPETGAKQERVAHRFQCTTRGARKPRVKILGLIRF